MTNLQHDALGVVPLSAPTVESFYDGTRSGTAEQCLEALCKSHERLRAEMDGMDVLLRDSEAECDRLRARLAAAVALTDGLLTGEPEPGWRVVERIREVLLGS